MEAMAGGIKIINILKGDSFEEVFTEFMDANAHEVILIFPSNSPIAKNEAHFVSLAHEAQNSGKVVTIMTADENVKNYSRKYGFKFLASPGKSLNQDEEVQPAAADKKNDDENETIDEPKDPPLTDEEVSAAEDELLEEEALEEEPSKDEEDDGTTVELAMARYAGTSKSSAKSKKLASEKKLENLESIWFKGGRKTGKESSSIWSNIKLFRRPSSSSKTNLYILTGAVIALGLVFYFFLGNAQIILKPQKEAFDFEMAVLASSDYPEVDSRSGRIPGQLLTYAEEVSRDFLATGQKEVAQKARGVITVYNNYNSDSQLFVATTRFESPLGLIFRTPRPITIPGARLVGGKLIPGTVSVEILADKPGPAHNIAPTRFTIPGLKGSPKYDGFYAESSQTFTGGITGLSKVITESDFNRAKEEISKQAVEGAAANLKLRHANLKIIDPIKNKITSLKSTAEAEQAVNGFAMKAVAEAKTIGFAEEDILELIRLYISKDREMIMRKDTLEIDYQAAEIDLAKEEAKFTIAVRVEAAAKVDEARIIRDLLGMKESEIKDYFWGIKEIESAKIILSPFWVKTVPKNSADVKIQLLY